MGSVNGCYKVSAAKPWSEAGSECQSLDSRAHLVIITSAAEMGAIASVIYGTDGQCYTTHYFQAYFVVMICFRLNRSLSTNTEQMKQTLSDEQPHRRSHRLQGVQVHLSLIHI